MLRIDYVRKLRAKERPFIDEDQLDYHDLFFNFLRDELYSYCEFWIEIFEKIQEDVNFLKYEKISEKKYNEDLETVKSYITNFQVRMGIIRNCEDLDKLKNEAEKINYYLNTIYSKRFAIYPTIARRLKVPDKDENKKSHQ
jgi:hypothetical protein